MRKDVLISAQGEFSVDSPSALISLLAITGAPVAALADADVVIDKTAWTGDDLTVSEDGSVTVSTGKEVSIEKELAPGKYMLQPATFTDKEKIF